MNKTTGELLLAAHDFAKDNRLVASHPWRLAAEVAHKMYTQIGYAPPGGWSAFVALAAGAGAFVATNEGFEVGQKLEDPDQALYDAFAENLCPPAAAAALLFVLGMNPIQGLMVARSRHTKEQLHGGLLESDILLRLSVQIINDRLMNEQAHEVVGAIVSELKKIGPGEMPGSEQVDILSITDLLEQVYAPIGIVTFENGGEVVVNRAKLVQITGVGEIH